MSCTRRPSRIGPPPRRLRDRGPTLPFKVFLGYADLPAVRCASETIADAIRSTGRRFSLEPMLWSYSQLATEHWRDRAIRAALEADIVVLTSSQPGTLSDEIEHWIQSLLAANRGRPTTLAVISGLADAWTITIEAPPGSKSTEPSGSRRAFVPDLALAVPAR